MKRACVAFGLAVGVALGACKGGGASGGGSAPAVVPGAPAGDVTEIAGDVRATCDGKTRTLAKGDSVAGDDVITTGADGRVTIVLRHNHVAWSLGPNKEKKVADSAAWSATAAAGSESVGDDHSTAAGRHAERSATDTETSAPAPAVAAAPAPAAAEPAPAAAAAPAHAAAAPAAEIAPSDQPAAAAAPAAEAAAPPPPPPPPAPPPRMRSTPPAPKAEPPAAKGAPSVDALDDALGAPGGGAPAPRTTQETRPHGRATLGEIDAAGGLGSAEVGATLRRRLPQLRACYERALVENPALAGLLTLQLEVGVDGKVTSAKVDGDASLAEVRACVRQQLAPTRFSPAPTPTSVSAKMVLAPQG
jgi:hypothetical protein